MVIDLRQGLIKGTTACSVDTKCIVAVSSIVDSNSSASKLLLIIY